MFECMLCSEIVLQLNVADVLYAGRLVSEQYSEWLVRLFSVHVESFVVCILQRCLTTRYYVNSVGMKPTESFSVNPIVVHVNWEQLSNRPLQLPRAPLVQEFE